MPRYVVLASLVAVAITAGGAGADWKRDALDDVRAARKDKVPALRRFPFQPKNR
jgi:hypothetical protein